MKYSANFKLKVVQDYLHNGYSYYELSKKYHIPSTSNISRWLQDYQQNGPTALIPKHSRKRYTTEYKLEVVNYYRTHDISVDKVAILYGIHPSQVNVWYRRYKNEGIVGLRPKAKGRPPKIMKRPKKNQNLKPTEREAYQQRIADLEAKVAYQNMELDILKKLRALRQQENANKQK